MLIKKCFTHKLNKLINNKYKTNVFNLNNQIPDKFISDIYKCDCINALNSENPYELVYVLEKHSEKCVGRFIGGTADCRLDFKNLPKNTPLILLHGHPANPNGASLPVSLQDFIIMNDTNIEKIVAYGIDGRQSFLKKQPDFVPLNSKEIKMLKRKYLDFLINSASVEDKQKIDKLIKYCINNKNAKAVKHEIAEKLNELQYKSGSRSVIDSFWRDNAEGLKLIYYAEE